MRIADRILLRDHALKHRQLFLRGSLLERVRRWLRVRTFGIVK